MGYVDDNEEVEIQRLISSSMAPGNTKFFLLGVIEPELVDKFVGPFMQAIDEQADKRKPKPLTLYLSGPGGYWDSCTTILSLMTIAENAGLVVRTVAIGEVASASSMIAVAGTAGHRYIAPTAEHMIHLGWTSAEGESQIEINRSNAQAKRFFRGVAKHYADHCDIPNLKKHVAVDQFYVTAKQCIAWELADHYLAKFVP